MELSTDPLTRQERDALMAAVQHPERVGNELLTQLGSIRFANASLAVVRDAIAATLIESGLDAEGWVERVSAQASPGFEALVSQLAVAPIPQTSDRLDAYCRDVVVGLVDRDLLRQKADVLGSMQRSQAVGDAARAAELGREAARLEEERRRLRAE